MGERRRTAFTIIELLVAVSILMVVIAGVGLIFRSTGRAVGASEATLNMTANVRAVQDQMQRDLAGLDHDGFLVIRTRTLPVKEPGKGHPTHIDQVAFVTLGNFPYKFSAPYRGWMGEQTAHAALVWYGQLAVEGKTDEAGHYLGPADQSKPPPGHKRSPDDMSPDPFNVLPSGDTPSDYLLGRHATLLLRPLGNAGQVAINGATVPAYEDANYFTQPVLTGEGSPADISSSRVSLAAITTSELMQHLEWRRMADSGSAKRADPWAAVPEEEYCFRFKTLIGPWATEIKAPSGGVSLTNAVDRMQVGFLPGVTSFQVEYGSTIGAMPIDWSPQPQAVVGDDPYAVGDDVHVFSRTGGGGLLSCLRITMRVADPDGRLPERTFQQVIKLPD